MESSLRASERIDKRHARGLEYGLRLSVRRIAIEESLSDIVAKIMDPNRKRETKVGLRRARQRLTAQLVGLRSKEHRVFSALWGLPLDLVEKRLTIQKLPSWRTLPRVTLSRWSMCSTEAGSIARAAISRVLQSQLKIKNVPCSCQRCRVATICPDGHGIFAGVYSCGFCGWQRHDGPPHKRWGGNRRGDRKNLDLGRAPPRLS